MAQSRLITGGVFVLGAVMILIGLWMVVSGVPLVRMEIGWVEVIGGVVAASAGCVVLVMGVFLLRIDALQALLRRAVPAGFDAPVPLPELVRDAPAPAFADAEDRRDRAPVAPVQWRAEAEPLPATTVRPEPPLMAALHPDHEEAPPPPIVGPALDESAASLFHAEEEEAAHTPPVLPPSPVVVAEAPARASRPNFLSSLMARRNAARTEAEAEAAIRATLPETSEQDRLGAGEAMLPLTAEPEPAAASFAEARPEARHEDVSPEPVPHESTEIDTAVHEAGALPETEPADVSDLEAERASLGPDLSAVLSPLRSPEPEPAPEPEPLKPVVVGRYNAGSASYVMYSNGMIEVETEQGTHQFGSMAELKSFIERRDARVS